MLHKELFVKNSIEKAEEALLSAKKTWNLA